MSSFAPVTPKPKSTDYSVRYGINGGIEAKVKRDEFLEKHPLLDFRSPDEKNGIGGNMNKNLLLGGLSIIA